MKTLDHDGFIAALLRRLGVVTLLLIVLIIVIGLLEPRFFSRLNQLNVLRNAAFLILAAYGQMLVMIVGGFDLSVGVVAALSSIATATVMGAMGGMSCSADLSCGWTILLGVSAGLASGVLVGLINGLCVALGRVSAFMITLGMMTVVGGIVVYWTNGVPIYGIPESMTAVLGRGAWFRLPIAFWLAMAIGALLWLILNHTRLGLYLYAVGSNIQASRMTGLPTTRTLLLAYMCSGLFAAMAGILMASRIGSGQAGIGGSLMIQSIAAAVIGGVSLRGGVGKVERVIAGCLLLAIVENSLNLLRIESKLQALVMGVILLAAVSLEQLSLKRSHRD